MRGDECQDGETEGQSSEFEELAIDWVGVVGMSCTVLSSCVIKLFLQRIYSVWLTEVVRMWPSWHLVLSKCFCCFVCVCVFAGVLCVFCSFLSVFCVVCRVIGAAELAVALSIQK